MRDGMSANYCMGGAHSAISFFDVVFMNCRGAFQTVLNL